jgi:hypothetical protein
MFDADGWDPYCVSGLMRQVSNDYIPRNFTIFSADRWYPDDRVVGRSRK